MVRRVVRQCSQELQDLMLAPAGGRFVRPMDAYDEVYPGIILSDGATALSTNLLKNMRVTHVLNAAQGRNDVYYGGYINTNENYYLHAGIKFMGVPAQDSSSFYLKSYFKEAASFIDDAVRSGGKVLVHCQCGISRSATLVAAYLMYKKRMDVKQALTSIRMNRSIFPNQGFLSQLCDLDYELRRAGDLPSASEPVSYDNKQVKDSRAPRDKLPTFTSTNYYPLKPNLTKSGYPIASAQPYLYGDSARHVRARSEERVPLRFRERSLSPVRHVRASSVLPDPIILRRSPEPIDRYETSPAVDYNTGRLPREPCTFIQITKPFELPEPRISKYYPTGHRAMQNMAYLSQYRAPSLERSFIPRDTPVGYDAPFASHWYSSPRLQRNFTTYKPRDTPNFSSYTPSRSYRCSYTPSVLKYPSLLSPSLYSRIFKA